MYGYYNKQTYFHGTTYENFFEEKKIKAVTHPSTNIGFCCLTSMIDVNWLPDSELLWFSEN